MFDRTKPTAQMLGKFNPFHGGHLELFKRAIAKTGQVIVMVRDIDGNDFSSISAKIELDLSAAGFYKDVDYVIESLPNITDIVYGRDVGYEFHHETFTDEIHAISSTNIRNMKS